jgi:hypothetical protein
MRKLGLVIIYLFFALPIALVAVAVNAAPIPSAASGVYMGTDRVCRVVLARYQVSWVQTSVTCMGWDGNLTNVLSTLYAPGSCPDGASIPFYPQSPTTEHLSIRSYDGVSSIAIVRGPDPTAVTNGIGIAESWMRVAPAASPAPYSCTGQTGAQPHYPRLCREFGIYCGG